MPFAARDLLSIACLACCAQERRKPLEDELAFMELADCRDKVALGLQWLVHDDAPVARAVIHDELDHCVGEQTTLEVRREIANVLASEPHRSRFVHLLVKDRAIAMGLLDDLPLPILRPFLGTADQPSLRAAVLMDDLELDIRPEPISPAWRRFIDRSISDIEGPGVEMRLIEAFRDPETACVDSPSSPAVRRELIRAIRQLSMPPSRTNIASYVPTTLRRDPDPAIRRELLRIYGTNAAFRAAELREAAMSDPDLRVRATAYAALEDVTGVPVPAAYLRSP